MDAVKSIRLILARMVLDSQELICDLLIYGTNVLLGSLAATRVRKRCVTTSIAATKETKEQLDELEKENGSYAQKNVTDVTMP